MINTNDKRIQMLTPEEKIIFDKCIPHLPGRPIMFDVGAYKGAWTDYALSRVPDAYCVLFEPNDVLYAEINRRPKYNMVITDHTGRTPFFRCLNKADEMSSIFDREVFGQVDYVEEEKLCATIDMFCTKGNIPDIDFLKIDVEGAELKVLRGAAGLLAKQSIHFIQVEYGGTYPDAGITFKDVLRFVNQFGYKAYELVGDILVELTEENFVEDYRFANFLITHHDIK